MRTDRELLELAAKAAAITANWGYGSCSDRLFFVTGTEWTPFTDDGDNRRLQLKLRLGLVPLEGGGWDCITWDHDEEVTLATDFDPNRAVVRAAAEIGTQAHPDHKDGGAVYG